jgi:hypothetical protein
MEYEGNGDETMLVRTEEENSGVRGRKRRNQSAEESVLAGREEQ